MPGLVNHSTGEALQLAPASDDQHELLMKVDVQQQAAAAIAEFEEMTKVAAQVQERVLHDILRRNARTEYLGSTCGLRGRTDAASFKACVPLVCHADLQPFFQRIADGDPSPILTADPVTTLSLSSGTTSGGQQKYLILYKEILDASFFLFRVGSAYRAREFPIRPGGKVLELAMCGKLSKTKGGLITGTATTHLFRSKEFKLKQRAVRVEACAPEGVVTGGADSLQAMYCHLLCGLLHWEQVEYVSATFAFTMVEAMRTLEARWRPLCDDIRHGRLSPSAVSDPSLRAPLSPLLAHPNPPLADLLSRKFLHLDQPSVAWHAAIPYLWTNCKYVLSITTGSMDHYAQKLRHYAGPALPLVSGDYGATESWIAVNANPRCDPSNVSYTVVPSFAYFEFIPVLSDNDDVMVEDRIVETVGLTEVKVGHEYELVMTTYGGLYRYRLGDIVRVTGFMNASPQLAYVCRRNVSLCINIDKNTENDVQRAVGEAAKLLGGAEANDGTDEINGASGGAAITRELVDYTSYADRSTTPGHYVVFWELKRSSCSNNTDLLRRSSSGTTETLRRITDSDEDIVRRSDDDGEVDMEMEIEMELMRRCATALDLGFVDPGYTGPRQARTIGPLELCVVAPGTFRRLLERYLARCSAAITQYKTPRCTSSPDLLRLLRSSVLYSTFSAAYNHS